MSYYMHDIPGRLRIKTPLMKNNREVACAVESLLLAMGGVANVAINPTTGSCLVNYDPQKAKRDDILSALVRMSEQAPFYVFTAFVFAYAVGTLKMSRDFILLAVMVAACVSFFTIPLAGHFSDVIGRKKMYLIGVVVMGLFGFVYFAMVDSLNPALVFLAIVLSLIPHDLQYGPQAALIAEAFTPRLRYSGASLGYQLASIIAGGPAPLIATYLFATYKTGFAISWYIAILAVISFIATLMMPDYTGKAIGDEAYSED